jgi:hypothetical protein
MEKKKMSKKTKMTKKEFDEQEQKLVDAGFSDFARALLAMKVEVTDGDKTDNTKKK